MSPKRAAHSASTEVVYGGSVQLGDIGRRPNEANAHRLLSFAAIRRGHYVGRMEPLAGHRCLPARKRDALRAEVCDFAGQQIHAIFGMEACPGGAAYGIVLDLVIGQEHRSSHE